jgi:hypothetical protein
MELSERFSEFLDGNNYSPSANVLAHALRSIYYAIVVHFGIALASFIVAVIVATIFPALGKAITGITLISGLIGVVIIAYSVFVILVVVPIVFIFAR